MKAKTARYEGVSGLSKTRVSGEVDYRHQYYTWRFGSDKVIELAVLHRGPHLYVRQPTGQWCLQRNTAEAQPVPSAVSAALGSLVPVPPKGSHPRYVGPEMVRGVTTSHFHLGGATPIDLWVDGQNLLRRVSEGSAIVPFTEEFFDYGVNVTFTEPTANPPECQHR